MDRDDDIKDTLSYNLDSIKHSKLSKIHLIDFNNNCSTIIEWAKKKFKQYIVEKKLYLHQEPKLKYWHFSIAKNRFKKYITSDYYSSLDGDNYISKDEVEYTESLINTSVDVFIHHFSGTWGDGTCGRITLPTYIYKNIGYQENLFPRQFDEVSLMIKTVLRYNSIPFYCVNKHIFLLSHYLNQFIENNNISINTKIYDFQQNRLPLNNKKQNYTKDNMILDIYSNINRIISLYPLSNDKYKKILNSQFEIMLKKIKSNQLQEKLYVYVFDKIYKPYFIHKIEFLKPYLLLNNKLKIKPLVGDFDIPACRLLWLELLS